MKRLTKLFGMYCVSLGHKKGAPMVKPLMAFIDYVWIHKNDEL